MQYLKAEVMGPFIFSIWLFIPEMPAIVLQSGIQALTFVIAHAEYTGENRQNLFSRWTVPAS